MPRTHSAVVFVVLEEDKIRVERKKGWHPPSNTGNYEVGAASWAAAADKPPCRHQNMQKQGMASLCKPRKTHHIYWFYIWARYTTYILISRSRWPRCLNLFHGSTHGAPDLVAPTRWTHCRFEMKSLRFYRCSILKASRLKFIMRWCPGKAEKEAKKTMVHAWPDSSQRQGLEDSLIAT